jgi:Transport protein Avl9
MATASLSCSCRRSAFVCPNLPSNPPHFYLASYLIENPRSVEEFSYFTLRKEATASRPATSLFGVSCTRQMDSASLINRPADVTRSTVQKALVAISDRPQQFALLKEKLSVVTKAWFAQRCASFNSNKVYKLTECKGLYRRCYFKCEMADCIF